MNILTFDIEEWYIEKHYKGNEKWKYDAYDSLLKRVLDILDENDTKATFFCLGSLAIDFPYVLKLISERGHEIGSHSLSHLWVNQMTPDEFYQDTKTCIDLLEQTIGKKIRSFRAPAFSIGESNKWAFDVLVENGILNDASIFPTMRYLGGFSAFEGGAKPCRILLGNKYLNEFPITIGKLPVINKDIAYSGGGYFRLLPLSFVKNQINKADYVMCYFHMADLVTFKSKMLSKSEYEEYFKEPGSLKNRLIRVLKSNVRRKKAFPGLVELISNYNFINIQQAATVSSSFPEISLKK